MLVLLNCLKLISLNKFDVCQFVMCILCGQPNALIHCAFVHTFRYINFIDLALQKTTFQGSERLLVNFSALSANESAL